ncbi:MAG: FtsX-like permease family protein [Eubacteriales bacterium]|nr:FtsX-like permease family protein [Eubacteriales bacterium]
MRDQAELKQKSARVGGQHGRGRHRLSMYLKMLSASLLRRKSRMLVALLAVAVGSTILSGLLTIYYDIPRQLEHEFRSYGANLIILPKDASQGLDLDLPEKLAETIEKSSVVGIAPYAYRNVRVNELPYRVAATKLEEAHKNSPYWLIKGEFPDAKGEVLIGNDLARNIGLKAGDEIIIGRVDKKASNKQSSDNKSAGSDGVANIADKLVERSYRVSGVVVTGGAEDSLIFMDFDDLKRLDSEYDGRYNVIECSIVGDAASIEAIANRLKSTDPSLNPRPAKRLTASQDVVLDKLKSLIWLVTFIVLILTMISVSTTMMAVVTERRKEIALKKALGATNQSVVLEFLGEGLMLGLLGGALGCVLGYFFARRVSEEVFARAIVFHPILIPLTLILASAITVLACLHPVRKTIEVKPALVLKGE